MHKILIVDDEEDILDTLEGLIEHKLSACDITKATNGLDGFIQCQKTKFDLIISDHKMPFMTGAAFIIALRTRETQNPDTPVIVLSAHIDEELRKKLTVQNVRFVEKPFTPNDFLDIIRTYLV
ncbi:MAG: response regulator [Bdellovibrionota bacterium]|nr:response regulator [Bdellovibrionota bacterium]